MGPLWPWAGPNRPPTISGVRRGSDLLGLPIPLYPTHGEPKMEPWTRTTAALLSRQPSPALPVDDLRELILRETPEPVPREEHLLVGLADGSGRLRVIRCPRRRWATPIGPRAWILAGKPIGSEELPLRPLLSRLRSTLRCLGRWVEPESAQAWARWTRFMEEEGAVRRTLGHRMARPRDPITDRPLLERPRTTNPPRVPPAPGRTPGPRRPSPSRRPHARAPRSG